MFGFVDFLRPKLPTTHGSAREATRLDLTTAQMLEPAKGCKMGPIVCRLTPDLGSGREVRYVYANGGGHLMTAAPTNSGKSQSQMIPNLLWWPGSAFVLDLKDEIYLGTSGYRASAKHRIIRFAPFGQGAHWNPIDYINEGASAEPNDPVRQENVSYLGKLIIIPNKEAKEPYWDKAAQSLAEGMMLHVATAPIGKGKAAPGKVRARTMGELWRLLNLDPVSFDSLIKDMAASTENWVAECANKIMRMAPAREQTASVITILLEHLKVWSLARVQGITDRSDFSFREMRDQPTTFYLCIPPDTLSDYRAIVRVMIGCCMRDLRITWDEAAHAKEPPVLLMLDEFPQLGYMQPIEDALLYLRHYGARFWFFVQDLSQLTGHYPVTYKQFIANCETRSFFSVNDMDTAKLVSEMSGTSTVRNPSFNSGTNESIAHTHGTTVSTGHSSGSGPGGGNSSSSSGTSYSDSTTHTLGRSFGINLAYMGRPLYMPDELLRLPFDQMIVLAKGLPAIRGGLNFWRERKELLPRGLMAPPP